MLLITAGAALRLYGLHWGDGHLYHPDEHNMAMAATRLRLADGLDPGFHAYNGLAIYAQRLLAELAGWWQQDAEWAHGWHGVIYAGRWISATASVVTLILFARLGHVLAGRCGALILAALAAFQVGLIQAAHYATTESLLILFLTAVALVCARLLAGDATGHGVSLPMAATGSGLLTGLACATKTTGLAFALIPLATLAMAARRFGPRNTALALVLGLSVGVFAALLASPHSLLDWQGFRSTMQFERSVVDGRTDVFWTLQFADTAPWLFQAADLPWLIGPLTPVLVVVGAFVAATRAGRVEPVLPLLLFGLAYAAYVGGWHAKFVRYSLPLVPALVVLAAIGALWCWRSAPGRVLVLSVLAANLAWAVAFTGIYRGPDARTAAWNWLDRHAAGEVVLLEGHDVAPRHGGRFEVRHLPLYAPDDAAKADTLARELAGADFLVLLSRRGEDTLPRLPDRFPVMTRHYAALREGALGYVEVARFENLPRIGSLRIGTGAAEQTFQVFDHPTVTIFANSARHDAGRLARLLAGEPVP